MTDSDDSTHPTFTVRPAVAEDLGAVSTLLAAAKLAPNGLDAQFGPQFAVAVDSATGEVIGAAGVELYRDSHGDTEATYGLLRSAVVDERLRGHGVGAALTEDRLSWAERERLSALYLLTETAADYWPRFGFTRTARDSAPAAVMMAHEWKQGCPASAVAMRLQLPRADVLEKGPHL